MTLEQCLHHANQVPGYPDDAELEFLYDSVKDLGPENLVVEIGCDLGKSTTLLGLMARELGFTFYTVDPFANLDSYEPFVENMKHNGLTDTVHLIKDSSLVAHALFKDESIDVLFNDGDHAEEGVDGDCKVWLQKIKRGGLALFHDYGEETWPGVTKAVDKYMGKWKTIRQERVLIGKKKA